MLQLTAGYCYWQQLHMYLHCPLFEQRRFSLSIYLGVRPNDKASTALGPDLIIRKEKKVRGVV